MTPCKRVRLTGTIPVPLPPKDAFTLFTPTGERAWAPGWNPQFPSPVTDDTEPGTVFQTDHASRRSTWTVTRHDPATTIQYATTTPLVTGPGWSRWPARPGRTTPRSRRSTTT